MTVTQCAEFFYRLEIVHQQDEQALIKLANDGLKEEIREGLETAEFPSLEALFEEASEVEKILEMEKTPPISPRKLRRNSPDNNPHKGARKTDNKEDPEDEGYYDWGWCYEDTHVDEDEEDMSDYPDEEIESGSDEDLSSGSDG
ncbi:hypothetical protein Bca4012_063332 [Brassica carinata]